MAGIDSLLSGGAKSLAKDKASEYLSPQLRELLPLVLNPQGYLMGKAVSSLADVLGYGNEVQDLQQGAKGEKDYYKETMRDALGDVLPGALGDFVRATPNTPYEPVGSYWDPEQNAFVNPNQNNLDQTGQTVNSNEELREGLYGTITPLFPNFVGPQEENSQADQIGMQFLPVELGVKPTSTTPNTGGSSNISSIPPEILQAIMGQNVEGKSLQEDMNNISRMFGNSTPESLGFTEANTDYGDRYFEGGGGGKLMSSEYAKGGQIYRGIR